MIMVDWHSSDDNGDVDNDGSDRSCTENEEKAKNRKKHLLKQIAKQKKNYGTENTPLQSLFWWSVDSLSGIFLLERNRVMHYW